MCDFGKSKYKMNATDDRPTVGGLKSFALCFETRFRKFGCWCVFFERMRKIASGHLFVSADEVSFLGFCTLGVGKEDCI